MLTPENGRRRLRGLAAAMFLTTTMLVPASATLAMDAGAAEIEPVEPTLTQPRTTLDELRTLVDDLSLANNALEADKSTLQRSVDTLSTERDRLRASLARFDDLYDPMESDRQLLFELRKNLPETRPEAEAQLTRIRNLALSSDPARLGQLVDRVSDAAPAFLDWRFGEFETTADFSNAYVDTGANAFDSSMEDFRSEVLMSVANRLDGLLTILDRVR
jgi:ABC-type transporter Mla subunit MlaD